LQEPTCAHYRCWEKVTMKKWSSKYVPPNLTAELTWRAIQVVWSFPLLRTTLVRRQGLVCDHTTLGRMISVSGITLMRGQQDPILSSELHLVKRIRPGFWASLDLNF
jgi:hypothetical protein